MKKRFFAAGLLILLCLTILPLAVFGLFSALKLYSILPYATIIATMPCGLNPIVFPKLVGKDCKTGARLAFLSHLFSCVTLPLWLSILKF